MLNFYFQVVREGFRCRLAGEILEPEECGRGDLVETSSFGQLYALGQKFKL
jgi:hypothetical protein